MDGGTDAVTPNEWLPARTTPLVGRDELLRRADDALRDSRVLTLVGPGGAGKTRLAAELAAHSDDRVVLVRLALVTDPADVLQAIATAAEVEVGADRRPLDACAEAFRKPTLLVLDNCEQVVEACAAAVHELLARCEPLTVVATSREALRVAGERLLPVPPLELAYAEQLFLDRLRRVQPDVELDEEASRAVERICRRLDGLPLALELAAARARVLSLADISAGLDEGSPLEAVAPRSLPERHRSLTSCLDWSYRLLTGEERHVLHAASAFQGGFDLAALAFVAERDSAACLELLAGLVDKSLIGVEYAGGRSRYRLLETIRDFASRRAPAMAELHARHARWYLDRIIGYDPSGITPEWVLALHQQWRPDLDNLRLALANSGSHSSGERLLAATGASFVLDAHEAVQWLLRALAESTPDDGVARAHAILALAGEDVRAGVGRMALLDEACRWVDQMPPAFSGLAFTYAATAHLMAGDAKTGARLLELGRRHDSGTPLARCGNLISATVQLTLEGRLDEAVATAREADELSSAGPRRSSSSRVLGLALLQRGDIDAALAALTDADADAVVGGPWWIAAETPGDLAHIHLLRGDDAAARLHAHEALERERPGRQAANSARVVLGLLALRAGDPGAALGPLVDVVARERAEGRRQLLTMLLPYLAEAFRVSGLREDARRAVDECLEYSARANSRLGRRLSLWVLARLEQQRGNTAAAVRAATEALTICHADGYRLHLADHIEELAGQLVPGRELLAARAYGAADRLRAALGTVAYPIAADERAGERRACEQADGYAAAHHDGYAADTGEVVDALLRQASGRRVATVGWDALTAAEVEVARLVADHLTNPQIAERLFISVNTVKTHLAHIFTKLDISSKSELVGLLAARRAAE